MAFTPQQQTGHDAEVVIIGAGPVGLTIANTLGLAGIKALVVERLPQIIDYPRAIGIDDESLRTLQAIGLTDQVQAHITPAPETGAGVILVALRSRRDRSRLERGP